MKLNIQNIRNTGNLELLASQLVEGFITGLHKSPYHGFSVEFAEHRLYNYGESTKNIDWKVYAKTDRLYKKQFEEETNLRCQILIDNSSSMYYPENLAKITYSILGAATLSYLLQKQRDAVGLYCFSDKIEVETETKSTGVHLHKLFGTLEQLLKEEKQNKGTAIAPVLHEIAERIHKRSLVILFSDMIDSGNSEELFSALQHLKHNKHEVILFHVYDSLTELNFEFSDKPHEFIDLEKGHKIKVQPHLIREAYKENMNKRFYELKMKCEQYKINLVRTDIQEDMQQVLKSFLIKRTKMN